MQKKIMHKQPCVIGCSVTVGKGKEKRKEVDDECTRGSHVVFYMFLFTFSTSSTFFHQNQIITNSLLEFSMSMSMSKDPVREWILSEGKATEITKISPVGGVVSILLVASIPMLVYSLLKQIGVLDHPFFFLAQHIGPSMFEAEALGLGAMYETGTIRVPKPYKVGLLPTGGSFIIMEFIQFGASRGYQSDLGRKLAEMHKAGKSSKGFGQRLVKSMGPLFANVVIEPCLLHGDLWSGNISSDINGEPIILDPACYCKSSICLYGS
ncbi:Protein-ribulosamine 3-kinase, chloroplastic [Glycine soja]